MNEGKLDTKGKMTWKSTMTLNFSRICSRIAIQMYCHPCDNHVLELYTPPHVLKHFGGLINLVVYVVQLSANVPAGSSNANVPIGSKHA